ncbi:MAG: outer membrane protein assembly factor BamA [Hyphomicrobiales bacterium]|nr:outer membrane protein assembly factor BamA [Hyphomicrobiales bacterium]
MTTTVTNRRQAASLKVSTAIGIAMLAMTGTAALAQAVVVQGNRRVDAETIRGFVARGESPDAIRRELMGTGLFSDVRVSRRGSQTVVSVSENNSINNVAFEGNRRLKSDFLSGEVQSRSRGPISDAMIASDIERIKNLYRRAGYNSEVTSRLVPLPNGRSDVVFTINEGSKSGIREIIFSGNTEYGSSRLKGLMTSTEMNLLSWFKTSDVYDPDKILSDLELVRRFYLRNGYADFRVVSNTTTFDQERGGYIVNIVVDEGPRYTVRDVQVSSRLRDVDPETLRRVISTNVGDTYNAEAVERSLSAVTVEVARRGYAFSQVRPTGQRDPATRTVSINYQVDEGPRVYVERINIRGNTRTMDEVIRREFDLGEGDAYNKVFIDRAERRLNNLGFFNRVRITNEPGSAPDRVVINVDLEDKATGSFSIAGGYSTSDGFIADVSLSESNFLGRGQFVRIGGSYGQKSRGIDFSFTEPYFMGQRIAAGFDLFSKFSDSSSTSRFTSQSTGFNLRATLPITEEFSITARYSLYQTQIKIPNTASNPFNDCSFVVPGQPDLTGVGAPPVFPSTGGTANCLLNGEASIAIKEARGTKMTSLAGLSFVYNALDNVKTPRNGFYAELRPDVAGLGGDSKFARISGEARYYREVLDDVVGFIRVQGGHSMSLGGGPLRIIDHNFLGPTLVRGFAPSGIGPRDVSDFSGSKTGALGGTTYFGGSVEVQFPIPLLPKEIGIRGAVFADAGTLFNFDGGRAAAGGVCAGLAGTKARFFDVNRNNAVDGGPPGINEVACVRDKNMLRSAVGASILWQSPLGPIRFDYAYALTYDKGVLGDGAPGRPLGFRYGGDRLQAFRFSGGASF